MVNLSLLRIRKIGTQNWYDVPELKTLQWDLTDFDSDKSGRNQLGDTYRDRKAKKRKLSLTFSPLSKDQMATILQIISDVFFEAEYPDGESATREVRTFYVGDRSAPMCIYRSNSNWLWSGLNANFIEK